MFVTSLNPRRLVAVVALIGFSLPHLGCNIGKEPDDTNLDDLVDEAVTVNGVGEGYKKDDRRADVIFVHGLGGDVQLTWQFDEDPTHFWPEWLSEDYPDIGFWSLDYEASWSKWESSPMLIQERAKHLLDELKFSKIGGRPLLFVTHSLGGLVVKKMLHDAMTLSDPRWQELAGNTRGVVFLGTPNAGSDKENLVQTIMKVAKIDSFVRPTDLLHQLEKDSVELLDLNVWYRENSAANNIESLVFYEIEPIDPIGLIVSKSSADPGITGMMPKPVQANHITIAKPRSKNAFVYRGVVDFIDQRLSDRSIPIEMTFDQFLTQYKAKQHDPAALDTFMKEYGGRPITISGVVQQVYPSEATPNWDFRVALDAPDRVWA